MPDRRRRDLLAPLLVALVAIAVLAFLVFRPFLLTFTVAASVALLLDPLHARLARAFGGRGTPAAALLVLVTTAAILVPLVSSTVILGGQLVSFLDQVGPRLEPAELEKVWSAWAKPRFGLWIERWEVHLMPLVSNALSGLAAGATALVQRVATGVGTAFYEVTLFLLMQFFLLRDGGRLLAAFRDLSPFSPAQEGLIRDHLGRTVKAVLQSMVVVPLAQGFVASVGFWLFGVPSPMVWGVAVAFAALVPILGSPLGWVPAVVYLVLYASTWQWVGMLVYGIVVVSGIDNVIKPMLLQGSADIHPLLGFLSILGGILAFGVLGLLVGPVILSLVLSALRIYRLDVLRAAPAEGPSPVSSEA
jgi:predicted PurR-regulated permease PerM